MSSRIALARIGKMVAAEVAEGHPGSASQLALKSIEAAPEIATDLIELIIKEGTKKRPDDAAPDGRGHGKPRQGRGRGR